MNESSLFTPQEIQADLEKLTALQKSSSDTKIKEACSTIIGYLKNPKINSLVGLDLKKLGRAYEALNEFSKMVRCYEKFVSLNPLDLVSWDRLIGVLFKTNQHQKAFAAIEELCHKNSQNPIAWSNAGSWYEEQKEYEKAAACLHQALELDPSRDKTRTRLAEIQKILDARSAHHTKQPNSNAPALPLKKPAAVAPATRTDSSAPAQVSQQTMKESLSSPPTQKELLNLEKLGLKYGREGNIAGKIKCYETVVFYKSDDISTWAVLIEAYFQAKRTSDSVRAIEGMLITNPDNANALRKAIQWYEKLGRPELSSPYAREVLQNTKQPNSNAPTLPPKKSSAVAPATRTGSSAPVQVSQQTMNDSSIFAPKEIQTELKNLESLKKSSKNSQITDACNEAITYFKKLEKSPADLTSVRRIGFQYEILGDTSKGRTQKNYYAIMTKCFHAVISRNPGNLIDWDAYISSLLKSGESKKACAAIEELCKQNPENPTAWNNAATWYGKEKLNQPKDAQRCQEIAQEKEAARRANETRQMNTMMGQILSANSNAPTLPPKKSSAVAPATRTGSSELASSRVVPSAPPQKELEYDDLIKASATHLVQGNIPAAFEFCNQTLFMAPPTSEHYAVALLLRASIHQVAKNPNACFADFDAAQPLFEKLSAQKQFEYWQKRDKACVYFERSLEQILCTGKINALKGNKESAKESFESGKQICGLILGDKQHTNSHARALVVRADFHTALGEHKEACADLGSAVNLTFPKGTPNRATAENMKQHGAFSELRQFVNAQWYPVEQQFALPTHSHAAVRATEPKIPKGSSLNSSSSSESPNGSPPRGDFIAPGSAKMMQEQGMWNTQQTCDQALADFEAFSQEISARTDLTSEEKNDIIQREHKTVLEKMEAVVEERNHQKIDQAFDNIARQMNVEIGALDQRLHFLNGQIAESKQRSRQFEQSFQNANISYNK